MARQSGNWLVAGTATVRILFVCPDYHSTGVEAQALRQVGHRATIFVPSSYPRQLFVAHGGVSGWGFRSKLWGWRLRRPERARFPIGVLARAWNTALDVSLRAVDHIQLRSLVKRHDVLYAYGSFASLGPGTKLARRTADLARRRGVRMFLKPSGCRYEDLKARWSQWDGGAVCGNCAIREHCHDDVNAELIDLANNYFETAVGWGYLPEPALRSTPLLAKSIDLDVWTPGLFIPPEHRLASTSKIRVLHSFSAHGRAGSDVNIKGSHIVRGAVAELQADGLDIELIEVGDVPSTHMRYLQAQADICVDQLIYGWWGSTSLECMALGKPVVCYLRAEFLASFESAFPKFRGAIPVVNADVSTFKEVLRALALDEQERRRRGRASRAFAEAFLNPSDNAVRLVEFLQVGQGRE